MNMNYKTMQSVKKFYDDNKKNAVDVDVNSIILTEKTHIKASNQHGN